MTVATPTIQLTSDSGDAADLITNSALLTFSTAATGVTRTYQINQAQATSKYEVPPEDGAYTVLVTDTDSSGSSASASITFTLDTVGPTTPVVSLESDTGDSAEDGVTRYAYLTENTSDTGATRSYSLNGVVSDSYALPSSDASYVLVVTDTDAAGNAVSTTLQFTLDTTLAAPTAVLSLDSGDGTDGITNAAGVSFSALTSGDIRTYTINDGEASDEFLTPTEEGTYQVVVIDKDTAGNTETATLVFELDKTLTAPKAVLAVDSGESEEDRITNSATLTLSVQDEDATRTYKITLGNISSQNDEYIAPVVDGSYTILVTDTDTAGNTDKDSVSFTLDTTLTTPTVAFGSGSDSGSSAQDAISNSAALVFTTADTDATRVYTLSKSGVVVSSGADYAAPSADGVYDLAVTDTDTAGNTKSATLGFTLDTTAPTVPTVILGIDSGTSGDRLTNSATLTFNSKDADATRSYTLSLDGSQVVQGTQYTTPTVDGDYVLVVQDTDTAGNTSSAEISFTLDATLDQPTVSLAYDSGTAADRISNNAALSFSEVASDVTRTYAVNNVSGAASYTAPTTDGAYTVVVTDKDTAGNIKTATLSFALDSSIKAPTVALANGYTGAGTTDSAAMVFNTKDADATRIYTITVGGGSTQYTEYAAPIYNGDYELTVTDTDSAGNTASASVDFALYTVLAVPTVALTTNSGNSSDTISNSAALTFSTAAPDVTRTYTLNGAAVATYVAPTADGSYTVVVTDTDSKQAVEIATISFTLDATLAAPTLTLVTDSGNASDRISNVAALALSAAAIDVTRSYTVNGLVVDALDTTADGAYAIVVKDTDQAGNEKSASLSFTLDTTLTTPTLGLLSGSTLGIANSAAMTFNKPDGDATRTYTITLGNISSQYNEYIAPVVDGSYTVLVTDTDTAGNTDKVSASFTLDTTLTTPTAAFASDTGSSAQDAISNSAALAFNTADTDATRVYTLSKSGVVVSSGADYAAPSADGVYDLAVTDTDTAGNTKSAALRFTLDTTAPTVPTVALANGYTGAETYNSAAMTFSTPDSDATRVFTITSNGVSVASATYVAPRVSGNYKVAVADTDTAGNSASASLDFTLEIIGKTVDFQAYHWKSHVLLGDVVISDGSQTSTTVNGLGQFTAVTESTLLVTAKRAIPALEADITSAAVNLQDAIAILKMVVGLDVNGSGKALSPYQALAADFNGDGVVGLTDAIGVLKHVVGLTQTSTPYWAFANEADLTVPAKASTTPGGAPAISSDLSEVVEADVHFGLAGYLVGDVDGSFAGLSTATNLLTSDSTYFTDLVTATSGLSLSQFGVYS